MLSKRATVSLSPGVLASTVTLTLTGYGDRCDGTGCDDGTFPAVMDALLNALQWPAMIVTLTAAWLVASQSNRKRTVGFWCFVVSNILWIAWGLHDAAYALIALQVGLFALNLRGIKKNDPELR